MNKELRELKIEIDNKRIEVENLLKENKIEEAKAAKDERKKLQDKFDVLFELEAEEEKEIKYNKQYHGNTI